MRGGLLGARSDIDFEYLDTEGDVETTDSAESTADDGDIGPRNSDGNDSSNPGLDHRDSGQGKKEGHNR